MQSGRGAVRNEGFYGGDTQKSLIYGFLLRTIYIYVPENTLQECVKNCSKYIDVSLMKKKLINETK